MGQINHFLIVYNLRRGELVDLRKFGADVDRATETHADVERQMRDRDDSDKFEIVLVGADSEATLHVTHSRYFAARELTPSF
jgi:hypothetical protein